MKSRQLAYCRYYMNGQSKSLKKNNRAVLLQPKTNMLGKVVQIYPITVRLELNIVDTIPVLF